MVYILTLLKSLINLIINNIKKITNKETPHY